METKKIFFINNTDSANQRVIVFAGITDTRLYHIEDALIISFRDRSGKIHEKPSHHELIKHTPTIPQNEQPTTTLPPYLANADYITYSKN